MQGPLTGGDVVGPDETLTVLLSERSLADRLAALSPRVRVEVVAPEELPGNGAERVQVWIPQARARAPERDFFSPLPRLRLVQLQSAGAEHFARRLPDGVALARARGAYTPATAEWVLAVTLAAQRGIPGFVRDQDARVWSPGVRRSLVGARVVVVGAGDIGRAVGRMLAPFDVDLAYVARSAREGVHGVNELPALLAAADVVVLIVPATPDTTRMVDAAFLAAMPDGALLVNAARGVVVDTDALVAELASGRLRAALDVTDPEPLAPDHSLWSVPNLLLTPHLAGTVPATRSRVEAVVTDHIRCVLEGRPLVGLVDAY
ncbi:NAD(P)-dependent oxidoreductase [Blastococcus sp. PRF04-17]|uniref:NAD(P)-dependent oxidoreductase n=1 Tax=Blastococcus sp. PRF04-17 TaxID=2933797 RepID=UPI001FF2A1AB|nr:NAD(P)-dependent oxidoreductase [Blastococcus sp. PRF04-17]UOY02280.1 phosphoglycerate dehydrogenase [Blastococcus sp. PRF04-17]